jgi:PHD/YefM family antitoxin component YafN of YafNO toxin-antitoxin module
MVSCRRVAGCTGWEVTTPYGKGTLVECDYARNIYTVRLDNWGVCYGLANHQCICWSARCLPAAIYVVRSLGFALEKFRENLKSFAKIFDKFTNRLTDGRSSSMETLENSVSSVLEIFKGGDVKESLKLTVEMQRSNMVNTLTNAQEKLISLLKDIDVKHLHDQSRSSIVELVNANSQTPDNQYLADVSTKASKAAYEQIKDKIDATMKTLYEVDLVAAIDSGIARTTSPSLAPSGASPLTIKDLMTSVNELVEMTSQTGLEVAVHSKNEFSAMVDMSALNELRTNINSSYTSLLNEVSSAQKQMSEAFMESKSGSKLVSGGMKLKDRVVGMLDSPSTPNNFRTSSPALQSQNYTNVFNAINKKLTDKTSVRALSTLRDKLVETVTTSEYAQKLVQTYSQSASTRISNMLVEWYERIFSSAQDQGLNLLAGKQLFESFLSAYTQVRISS